MNLWDKIALPGKTLTKKQEVYYYNTRQEFASEEFAARLHSMILDELESKGKTGVIFLCIGTDRSTGDSLGPLIGHKLRQYKLKRAAVIGTLERPVHAMNLDTYIKFINITYPDYVIVAVDASVGSADHIGYATLGKGAIRPGLGVSKELRAIGDISITGIVGGCTSHDPAVLQSVRLSIVMQLADCICESICLVERLWDHAVMI